MVILTSIFSQSSTASMITFGAARAACSAAAAAAAALSLLPPLPLSLEGISFVDGLEGSISVAEGGVTARACRVESDPPMYVCTDVMATKEGRQVGLHKRISSVD